MRSWGECKWLEEDELKVKRELKGKKLGMSNSRWDWKGNKHCRGWGRTSKQSSHPKAQPKPLCKVQAILCMPAASFVFFFNLVLSWAGRKGPISWPAAWPGWGLIPSTRQGQRLPFASLPSKAGQAERRAGQGCSGPSQTLLLLSPWFTASSLWLFWGYQFVSQLEISNHC